MQSFRKNYRGVSKKTRDARTYERTDGGEIIGSLGRRTSEEPKIGHFGPKLAIFYQKWPNCEYSSKTKNVNFLHSHRVHAKNQESPMRGFGENFIKEFYSYLI